MTCAIALVASAGALAGQSPPRCSPLAPVLGAVLDSAWSAYRAAAIPRADSLFTSVARRCPADPGSSIGIGYVRMRQGRLGEARARFTSALRVLPANYDALVGLGMAAYRAGDRAAARAAFERAIVVVPGDSLATAYLAQIPGAVRLPPLPAVVRPVETVVAARAGVRTLEVRDSTGRWRPMWIKGLNIGAALPGKHPSEFPPDDGTYDGWLALAARMGVNTVRVYTVHPPHFYRALAKWNLAHPSQPIWLIHGVWTELPPGPKQERYDEPAWKRAFRDEMRRVVDVVHGHGVLAPRPGHAAGVYDADVSRWTLAWIIGREWEPFSIVAYNRARPRSARFDGRYVRVQEGSAAEVWLAAQCEYMVAYEMDTYNAQRPVAYTNWPTLDPLYHPTESTLAQEDSIRRRRREVVAEKSREYDNDAVGLDGVKMRGTEAYEAGTFASYHAYPYYPDFMFLDPGYARARSPEGPSSYYGYLRDLVQHHGDMPVVISEYGVPSSRGVAHIQPQGWNHGGHSEAEQAVIDARLTRDIRASGAAGAVLFAVIDEWFKKNWLVIDFEVPSERKRLWLNVLDAEEAYGMIAMRPGRAGSAPKLDGRSDEWPAGATLYRNTDTTAVARPLQLRRFAVTSDEAWLYLLLEVGTVDWTRAHYSIGIDTYDPKRGDTRMPWTRTRSPVGLEFVIDLRGERDSRVLVDSPYNLYREAPIRGARPPASDHVYNRPFRTRPNDDGRYDTLTVEPNRRRIGRDGTVYPRTLVERNRLLFARSDSNTLADWYADAATGVIELRIPWGMLHVLDPSSRTVLQGQAAGGLPAGMTTDGFRFVVESRDPGNPSVARDALPRSPSAAFGTVATWTWPTWEQPAWHAEEKPVVEAMRATFNAIP